MTLEHFLKSIEARALKMARLATRNDDDALDLVQDAMIKLVSRYGQRQPEEWRPLFLKILENGILDWHRKEKIKRSIFFWRTDAPGDAESETDEVDPIDSAPEADSDPYQRLESDQMERQLLACIARLPVQQQQCFLLRCWEGLSVQDTARIMGLNEGSVKTHYSRALEKLHTVRQEQNHE